MITLLFIVAITASLAISLGYVNKSNQKIQESKFLVQCDSILEDLLHFLKTAPEVKEIKDAESLNMLLLTAAVIPLEYKSLRVFIEIKSARSKFNINTLSQKKSKRLRELFKNYLARFNVADTEYMMALLQDSMGGGLQDSTKMYESDLFDEKMWLYRDKITSKKQFDEILDYYVKSRHDPAIYKIPWDKLIRYGENNDTELDVNYLTSEVWQLVMPELEQNAAEDLSEHFAIFKNYNDLGFNPEEYKDLKETYKGKFYAPIVEVSIDVEENNASAIIKFEYDIKKKKGKNFEFHI